MTTSFGDWQPGHLRLNAPELYVLLHGPDASASEVFKLALHELICRDVITPGMQQQGSGSETIRTAVVLQGKTGAVNPSRSLRSLLNAFDSLAGQRSSDGGSPVTVPELARELRSRHDGKLSQWIAGEVMPTLVERGLYTKEESKRLGLISTTSFEPTPEGKAARAQLEASITRAEEHFPSWASDQPARAAAFMVIAGPALLLMPKLRPTFERFRPSSERERDTAAFGAEVVAAIADQNFNYYRLVDEADHIKVLDDNIDYRRLDQD